MHVVAIIAVGWIMIIGFAFFVTIGDIIGVKPEKLAENTYILFFIFLYIAVIIRKCWFKPSYINGKIDNYAKYETISNLFTSSGVVKKATFYFNNGERKFFRNIIFKNNIWSSDIRPLQADGIFFVDKSVFIKKRLHIWGAQIQGRNFIFLDDMNRPSLIVLILTTLLGLFALYSSAKADEPFFAVIGIVILISFIPTYLIEKRLFNRRMKLLDEAGVPRPLG